MTRVIAPPGSGIGAAYQGVNQIDTFFIGDDGALYVSWVVGGGAWNRPVGISKPNIAPPGAIIASGLRGAHPLAVYPDGGGTDVVMHFSQVNVFFIGLDGALYVATVIGVGKWEEPVRISAPNIAPPGGNLVVGYQTSEQLDVFFFDKNGALNVFWAPTKGINARDWKSAGISPTNIAPPGGRLAAHPQGNNQLDVLFFDNNGALCVSWVVGYGVWNRPVGISPVNTAPPGAGIACARQSSSNNQIDVLFFDKNGALCVSWTGPTKWDGPVGISPVNTAPPGGNITAMYRTTQLDVFFLDKNGALCVSWVVGPTGTWNLPVGISQTDIAPPGSPITSLGPNIFISGRDRWIFYPGRTKWEGKILPN